MNGARAEPLPIDSQAWSLTRKRIYILPTGHGVAFALVLVVMLLGATNYDNALAFLLAFTLLGVALLSIVHTYRNLAGLTVTVHPGRPVFAGSRARLRAVIDNRHGRRRFGVVVRRGRRDDPAVTPLEIAPERQVETHLSLATHRRGWLAPGSILIASRAPLGLFRAWSRVPCAARCLVYPRPEGDQPLPASGAFDADAGAERVSGEEDFSGLRAYRPGDPPRRIHWRVAARGDSLPVKQFDAGAGRDIALRHVDVLAAGTQARIAQLTAWVLAAEAGDRTYALELPGERVPAGRGGAHRDRCLRALALHGGEPGDAAS